MKEERQTKRYVKVTYQFLLILLMVTVPPLVGVAGYIDAGIDGAVVYSLLLFIPMFIAFVAVTFANEDGYVEEN